MDVQPAQSLEVVGYQAKSGQTILRLRNSTMLQRCLRCQSVDSGLI